MRKGDSNNSITWPTSIHYISTKTGFEAKKKSKILVLQIKIAKLRHSLYQEVEYDSTVLNHWRDSLYTVTLDIILQVQNHQNQT